ncbi:Teneurin-2 [Manis pentadactyla]|nr:Teneurin-2 [Manis pentadactyla]
MDCRARLVPAHSLPMLAPSPKLEGASSPPYYACLMTWAQTRDNEDRTKIIPHTLFAYKLYFLLPLYPLLPRRI